MAERWVPGERLVGEIARAVVRQLDPDDIVRRVDVDDIVRRIDVDEIVRRLDVAEISRRLDVEEISRRLDVEDIVARIDAQALVDRVDPDTLLDRVDVDRLLARVDLAPVLQRAGLAEIVTQAVGRTGLDTVRRRIVLLDALVERLTGSLLRQDIDSWPAGPELLVGDELGPLGDLDATLGDSRAWDVTGHHVGPLGRVLATGLDVVGAVSTYTFATSTLASLVTSLAGDDAIGGTVGGVVWAVGLALFVAGWFLLPLELLGRTPAMGVLGMRVVTREGEPPRTGRVLARCVAQLPSVLLGGVGYAWTLFDRRRRTLHDVVAGTAVVWDWGGRAATIASPLGSWVARHGDELRTGASASGDASPSASGDASPSASGDATQDA